MENPTTAPNVPDPRSEFEKLLKAAQEEGAKMMVSKAQSSRAHAIAMTNLETAQLWAELDRKEKQRIVESR